MELGFSHNIESLHIVDHISRKQGLNLTFPKLETGIISHDGEVHNTVLKPKTDKTDADIEIHRDQNAEKLHLVPATWKPAW